MRDSPAPRGRHREADSTWQASTLDKGGPYEFKFIAVSDGGCHEVAGRVQPGDQHPEEGPFQPRIVAHVPWEGITLVSKAAETLEIDALESLGPFRRGWR